MATQKRRKAFVDVGKFNLKVKYDNVKVLGKGLWGWVGAKNHDLDSLAGNM